MRRSGRTLGNFLQVGHKEPRRGAAMFTKAFYGGELISFDNSESKK